MHGPLMCFGDGPEDAGEGRGWGWGQLSKGGSWLETGFILNCGISQESMETPCHRPIQGPGSLFQIRKEMEGKLSPFSPHHTSIHPPHGDFMQTCCVMSIL